MLKDSFDFRLNIDEIKESFSVFTAKKINNSNFAVFCKNIKNDSKVSVYPTDKVERYIEDGQWKITH